MRTKGALRAERVAGMHYGGRHPGGSDHNRNSPWYRGLHHDHGERHGRERCPWAGSYDGYLFNVVTASDPVPINLASGTLDVTLPARLGGAHAPVYVYVTETGLTSPATSEDFTSILSVTNLPSGWSETETTYLDNKDTAYGTGAQLATTTASGRTLNSTQTTTTTETVNWTFSLTEVYEIVSNGFAGSAVSSEGIQAAPAPSLGSVFPPCSPSVGFCSAGSSWSVDGNPEPIAALVVQPSTGSRVLPPPSLSKPRFRGQEWANSQ